MNTGRTPSLVTLLKKQLPRESFGLEPMSCGLNKMKSRRINGFSSNKKVLEKKQKNLFNTEKKAKVSSKNSLVERFEGVTISDFKNRR
jgi:hypothetical protein